jgi:hypothetical protein
MKTIKIPVIVRASKNERKEWIGDALVILRAVKIFHIIW